MNRYRRRNFKEYFAKKEWRFDMTERRKRKILKRDRRRKLAQGIGAAAGVAVWTVIIGAVMAGEKKLEEYKPKFEDVPESEK